MNTKALQQRFMKLRSHKAFELFVVFVIIASALLVGAKTYDLHPVTQVLVIWFDRLITAIFLIEITIRFIGEEKKKNFFLNPWNLFDTLIVVVSMIPIDNTDMALVARLIRVFRVLRMVSIIPELRMLLNSLVNALPQLGYVLLLMFISMPLWAALYSRQSIQFFGGILRSLY
jgi:voltage-gated sodium channel